MKKYVAPYKLIEIIWDDAASNASTWVHKDNMERPEQVVTIGWLIKEDASAVYTASSIANDKEHEDDVGNTLTIPKGMIVSRREVKLSARSNTRNKLHPKPNAKEVHREPGEG